MNAKIEMTGRLLYSHLSNLKAQKKMTAPLSAFETVLEDHLEALRQDLGERTVEIDHYSRMVGVYSDAYEQQKTLTRNACVEARSSWDKVMDLNKMAEDLSYELETVSQDRYECSQKLASQTQTIISLHAVIKDLQASLASSQELLEKSKNYLGDLGVQSRRQILKAEAIAEESYELLEKRQKTIFKQRKMIESLTFELLSARKSAQKPRFKWEFWKKTPKVKALPK